mmetsp:Transcript_71821/g.114332  ORF Transcript_71821/g.114332 Transcript_71821/m.114332 type:complete len:302 (-) Transcript_71821:817-1722(-)
MVIEIHSVEAARRTQYGTVHEFHHSGTARTHDLDVVVVECTVDTECSTVCTASIRLPIQSLVVEGRDDILERDIAAFINSHREIFKVFHVILNQDILRLICSGLHIEQIAGCPVRHISVFVCFHFCGIERICVPSKSRIIMKDIAFGNTHRHRQFAHTIQSSAVWIAPIEHGVDKQRILHSNHVIANDMVARSVDVNATLFVIVGVFLVCDTVQHASSACSYGAKLRVVIDLWTHQHIVADHVFVLVSVFNVDKRSANIIDDVVVHRRMMRRMHCDSFVVALSHHIAHKLAQRTVSNIVEM